MEQRTGRDDFRFLDQWQQAVVMRQRLGHNRLNAHMFRRMKLVPSPASKSGREDQWLSIMYAEMPASANSTTKCVANGSPVTHPTLRQQGGTGEDGHIHLADCMDS